MKVTVNAPKANVEDFVVEYPIDEVIGAMSEAELRKSARERLLTDMANKTRQSLNTMKITGRTLDQIHDLAVAFRPGQPFDPDRPRAVRVPTDPIEELKKRLPGMSNAERSAYLKQVMAAMEVAKPAPEAPPGA